MDMNITATIKLTRDDVEKIIRDYLKSHFNQEAGVIRFNVSAGSDDRFHYVAPNLTDIEIKVKL